MSGPVGNKYNYYARPRKSISLVEQASGGGVVSPPFIRARPRTNIPYTGGYARRVFAAPYVTSVNNFSPHFHRRIIRASYIRIGWFLPKEKIYTRTRVRHYRRCVRNGWPSLLLYIGGPSRHHPSSERGKKCCLKRTPRSSRFRPVFVARPTKGTFYTTGRELRPKRLYTTLHVQRYYYAIDGRRV